MSRINVVERENANPEQAELLDAVQAKLGMVPNFLNVFANSPAALRAFLGLHGIAGEGSLDAPTRERIALVLAQKNACEYCVSAHTAIGRKTGLNTAEMEASRAGTSQDAKAAVAVKFARALAEHNGEVTTADEVEQFRCSLPLPLHARQMLLQLWEDVDITDWAAELGELLDRPSRVTRQQRFAMLSVMLAPALVLALVQVMIFFILPYLV